MEDDFNTADAISAIFEIVKLSNISVSENSSKALISKFVETMETLCGVLGIETQRKEMLLDADIEALICQRQEARKARDFARADAIRDELAQKGIILEDTREGVKWKRA